MVSLRLMIQILHDFIYQEYSETIGTMVVEYILQDFYHRHYVALLWARAARTPLFLYGTYESRVGVPLKGQWYGSLVWTVD